MLNQNLEFWKKPHGRDKLHYVVGKRPFSTGDKNHNVENFIQLLNWRGTSHHSQRYTLCVNLYDPVLTYLHQVVDQ